MIFLVLFAFLAGIVTVLSPCILPILPIILTSSIGGKDIGKSRPLGVVVGFVLSFTFFTLFLSTIVRLSGIPADTLRLVSVFTVGIFGISLLIPQFQVLLETLFSKMTALVPNSQNQTGFAGGVIIGVSLGLLWTPCVGPILASVISLALTGKVTLDAFLITLAYSLGTALPMFLIMLGGQNALRKIPWLLAHLAHVQKVFGLLMVMTAIGIYFNVDRRFQIFILEKFPEYGVGLTRLEDNEVVKKQLDKRQSEFKSNDVGKPMFNLNESNGVKAPDLVDVGEWFNSPPLSLEQLKGKVVLIDFWTYTCINCQRTLPYLKTWHQKYQDKGLVIIGVHAPEFEFEKSAENLKKAIQDFGIGYPVVQDNNFATWRAYNNRYWPAKYFIDKSGNLRHHHFGEGQYDTSERVIQELLMETGVKDLPTTEKNPSNLNQAQTPETYLGYQRIENFVSPQKIIPDKVVTYSRPSSISDNGVAYIGDWLVTSEYATPQNQASLELSFSSKEVYLVMRPVSANSNVSVKVFVDDKLQHFGADVVEGVLTVDSDRLYELVNLPKGERHLLKLVFPEGRVQLYAFTFG